MMDNRKVIYFLLLVGIIILFLSSISVDVSYSDTKRRGGPVYQDDVSANPLYVDNLNEVRQPNTIYAKIVSRPDVSVHKKLLEAENKFYSNRCDL
jgi:hypothetical protein